MPLLIQSVVRSLSFVRFVRVLAHGRQRQSKPTCKTQFWRCGCCLVRLLFSLREHRGLHDCLQRRAIVGGQRRNLRANRAFVHSFTDSLTH